MKVSCDRCGSDFIPELTEQKVSYFEAVSIYETFFVCPYCGNKYHVCYDSEETKQLKEQITRQRKRIRHFITTKQTEKVEQSVKVLAVKQKKLKRKVEELNKWVKIQKKKQEQKTRKIK